MRGVRRTVVCRTHDKRVPIPSRLLTPIISRYIFHMFYWIFTRNHLVAGFTHYSLNSLRCQRVEIRSRRQRDVIMIFVTVTYKQNAKSSRGEARKVDKVHTSRIVSVWDIIWMLTWDWLVGKLSVERDLARDREPVRTFLLLRAISVRRNTLDMYAELSPRIPKAVRRNFAGVTWKRQVDKLAATFQCECSLRSKFRYLPVSVCKTWIEQSLCRFSKSHSSTLNFAARSVCKIIKLMPLRPDRIPESSCYSTWLFTGEAAIFNLARNVCDFSIYFFEPNCWFETIRLLRRNSGQ